MPRYLVIVESPAKAKTIKKFLGSNYEVVASNGHVMDLPKSQMGIDIENDFEPKYITIRGKGELLAKLRKEVKKADKVYLATDPDREGEAISWHLSNSLKLDNNIPNRIVFNEITKNAVKNAIKNARKIDMNLVDAQQARRVLDRMVGYTISPLLWNKVKRGLSAGRVQSVALRIICDREEEINSFIPEEYWNLEAEFTLKGEKKPLIAKYIGKDKNKTTVRSEAEAQNILNELKGAEFVIREIKRGERVRKAPLPFTTSTLQQEAAKVLNFSTSKTMQLAQQLYEGIDIKGYGSVGLITYLRTDSVRISDEADAAVKEFIGATYGKEYVASAQSGGNRSGKKIQDAHEAIRPTNVQFTPSDIKDSLSRDQYRLYQLIWKRFVASRMQSAVYETTSIKIEGNNHWFSTSASKLVFEGFLSVYQDEEDEDVIKTTYETLTEGDVLELKEIKKSQHFTQPPPHYTEASLVKTLEELGIGRPSTYAPTISTIIARRYVIKENKNLYVTELGEAVNNIMMKAFPSIVDVNFTANMEALLDSVEDGTLSWKTIVRNFYPDLIEAVNKAQEELDKIKIEDEVSDEVCELCGRNMVIKYGPHGKFLGCPGFPDCTNTKPYLEKIGVKCPLCGGDIVIRKTKKGRKYFGCSNHPDCNFMTWQKPSNVKCIKCGEIMLEKGGKLVCSNENCGYVTADKNENVD
ncbi:DNA topoisomerase I [Herbinix hemicellulosilytica]|uniref:DNA topoisomerase 1 n=1 Tax=Herbinix hemicellulosilytica TaxID=1564487 RepID=A0A0H5SW76_HERHM|nr:type I DNA topoisomerase [Herbinix hemicellulosilytica]RBP60878.1 DNA topoisomerase I [Herbinix hemicellulosilytica]CRZ34573.1 DNA topoisomerase 1 [Herbinix hemicellulosilytica]